MTDACYFIMDKPLPDDDFRRLLALVSPEKRERIGRLRRAEDARRSLLGDILARMKICEKTGLPNRRISLSADVWGKPFLDQDPACRFNVSHSGNYVACALDSAPVGIDVEQYKTCNLKIAERFFCREEADVIAARPEAERAAVFYRIWTMKEAYVKRDGRGLGLPFNSFNTLSPPPGAFFHPVFSCGEAVCHVCTGSASPPRITVVSEEEIFSFLYDETRS